MAQPKSKPLALLLSALLFVTISSAQTIESVSFSSGASPNNNFQPIIGAPFGTSLIGANGSLEISASYGERAYEESTLSSKSLKDQSSIRIFPNPTSYIVNVDLDQLPIGVYRLTLLDINGNTVYSHTTKSLKQELNMSSLAVGTYFLQVQNSKSELVENFKIIKFK